MTQLISLSSDCSLAVCRKILFGLDWPSLDHLRVCVRHRNISKNCLCLLRGLYSIFSWLLIQDCLPDLKHFCFTSVASSGLVVSFSFGRGQRSAMAGLFGEQIRSFSFRDHRSGWIRDCWTRVQGETSSFLAVLPFTGNSLTYLSRPVNDAMVLLLYELV